MFFSPGNRSFCTNNAVFHSAFQDLSQSEGCWFSINILLIIGYLKSSNCAFSFGSAMIFSMILNASFMYSPSVCAISTESGDLHLWQYLAELELSVLHLGQFLVKRTRGVRSLSFSSPLVRRLPHESAPAGIRTPDLHIRSVVPYPS